MPFIKKFIPIFLLAVISNVFGELTLENKFTIDTLIFDTSTNKINVIWSIDTVGLSDSITFFGAVNASFKEADISGDVGGANQPSDSQFKNLLTGLTNPYQIDMGHGLFFDSTIYIGIWMKAKSLNNDSVIVSSAAQLGDDTKKSLKTPSFKWQAVNIPSIAQDSAFPIANGEILFKQTTGNQLEIDRVELANITIDSSFKTINVPNVIFRDKPIVPLEIGFKIPKILPNNLIEEQVGVYVIENGKYSFKHNFSKKDSIIWLEYSASEFNLEFNDTNASITLLADTVVPTIDTVSSPSQLSESATSIPITFKSNDNVSNVKWEILYARGDLPFTVKDSGYCDSVSDSVSFIKSDNLSELLVPVTGTRILLVISDGVNRSFKDISLSVTGKINNSFNMNANKWVPIYSKTTLTEDSLHTILNNASDVFQSGWSYDKKEQRFFRYYTAKGTDTISGWLEYSDTTAQYFNLEPGQVFWCKSRTGQFGIPYGTGRSNSLTTPYVLSIVPGKFTDFTLPYYFNVLMKDIKEANDTAAVTNHIDFYKWEEDTTTGQISAVPIYMSDTLKFLSSTNTLHSSYCLYNGSISDSLNIPGIADTVSEFLKDMKDSLVGRERIIKRRNKILKDNVAYVKWQTEGSGEWGKVLVSTSNNYSKTSFKKQPSGFGTVNTSITNKEGNLNASYASLPIDQDGLSTFILKLKNDSKDVKRVHLAPELIHSELSDFDIYFLDNEKLYDKNNAVITIQPGETKIIKSIAGSRSSLNVNKVILNKYQFAFINSYPNPFNSLINLKYRLPENVQMLTLNLYNSLGRKVYSFNKNDNLLVGDYFHTINLANENIASGTYILSMTATKIDGTKLNIQHKTLCIK